MVAEHNTRCKLPPSGRCCGSHPIREHAGPRLRGILIALTFCMAPLAPAARAQDILVSATVSADVVGVNDQFQLTIVVTGSGSGDAEVPRMSRLRGFQIAAGPSVSTQFQWINGQGSSSKSFIYVLLPEKEGEFTIEPIEVHAGGRVLRTEPITVRVTGTSTQPSRPSARPMDPFDDDFPGPRQRMTGDEVVVLAEIDRSSAYPGQQVTLTYRLLTQVGISGIQVQDSPPLTGFWVEEIEVPANPSGARRAYEGRDYMDFAIKKQALFPNAPGSLRIPPATFAVSARSAGGFMGIFGQPETLYRKTAELRLEVRPLPQEGRPADFRNAVGSFNLTSDIDRAQVSTGDAVTLRVRLAGRGNLKVIPDLPLPPLPDFSIYSSRRVENIRPFEGDTMGGDKTWEYVIVPKAAGRQTIPGLALSFFDAERGAYGVASTQPLSLEVSRGAATSGGFAELSGIGKQNLTRVGSDINFVKLGAADLDGDAGMPLASIGFWLLAVLPPALNAGIFLCRRRQARQAGNVLLIRRRRARGTALARLRRAEKTARKTPRLFYDGAANALGGYMADRFNLPEIAVAGDALERTLAGQGIDENVTREALACLRECDFGRFVEASAVPERSRQMAGRMRKVIDALERT